jgi:5-methylcytosine-specific restriction endonuclease McrA
MRRRSITAGCRSKPADFRILGELPHLTAIPHLTANRLSAGVAVQGGKNTWENLVTCCAKCNSHKGSKTLQELKWKLRTKPRVSESRQAVGGGR